MKTKRKPHSPPKEPQGKQHGGRGDVTRRRVWISLAAILLAIIFLAGECANLLPLD